MSQSCALYLYGLVRSGLELDLGPIGIDEDGAPARVCTLPAGRVAALVSARKDPASVFPLRRDVLAHQRVSARVMEAGTILPFAFGQVAGSEREVLHLLRAHEPSVSRELARLEGTVQMGVKVHWEIDDIYRYILDGDPELAALRESVFASAVPSVARRISLGERFAESLRARRAALVDAIVAALEVRVAPPKELPVRTEKAVADLMFLIGRNERDRFEEDVRRLAAAWPQEYVFRVTGPWAPFNFVEFELCDP